MNCLRINELLQFFVPYNDFIHKLLQTETGAELKLRRAKLVSGGFWKKTLSGLTPYSKWGLNKQDFYAAIDESIIEFINERAKRAADSEALQAWNPDKDNVSDKDNKPDEDNMRDEEDDDDDDDDEPESQIPPASFK